MLPVFLDLETFLSLQIWHFAGKSAADALEAPCQQTGAFWLRNLRTRSAHAHRSIRSGLRAQIWMMLSAFFQGRPHAKLAKSKQSKTADACVLKHLRHVIEIQNRLLETCNFFSCRCMRGLWYGSEAMRMADWAREPVMTETIASLTFLLRLPLLPPWTKRQQQPLSLLARGLTERASLLGRIRPVRPHLKSPRRCSRQPARRATLAQKLQLEGQA